MRKYIYIFLACPHFNSLPCRDVAEFPAFGAVSLNESLFPGSVSFQIHSKQGMKEKRWIILRGVPKSPPNSTGLLILRPTIAPLQTSGHPEQ